MTQHTHRPDEQRALIAFPISHNEEVRLSLVRYGREWRIDIRRFVWRKSDQEFSATTKGAFVFDWDLPAVIQALHGVARDLGLPDHLDEPVAAPPPSQAPLKAPPKPKRPSVPRKRAAASDARILELHETGESVTSIARTLGVSKATISRRLSKLRDASGVSSFHDTSEIT